MESLRLELRVVVSLVERCWGCADGGVGSVGVGVISSTSESDSLKLEYCKR
jgi:hypothetical protein